ncbi:SRPBCC domain-containing protein [Alteromonas sp. ASW11-130]|uniref:SRPBCC domain-containing protein n=1 Tax=Alteromonas sp. ASW11-130 TaxID=3015775 RepID=UPI002241CE88|nr:SRPBCC domain-containing protein [Alteromonas sp. ASW11-130]MCW8092448.1 SRPBCC domain-containing protein [Alteromonas sp. ASW11-130]
MKDVIQREIVINASQERIYKAIADPAQVIHWFPETVEGSFRAGEQAILGFGEDGKNQIYVVDTRAHYYFAFRWVPGCYFVGDVLAVPNTLVEFGIEKLAANRCKVTLTESGFSGLAEYTADDVYKQNDSGWDFMLDRLQKYFLLFTA